MCGGRFALHLTQGKPFGVPGRSVRSRGSPEGGRLVPIPVVFLVLSPVPSLPSTLWDLLGTNDEAAHEKRTKTRCLVVTVGDNGYP